jgi:hypothetical protein
MRVSQAVQRLVMDMGAQVQVNLRPLPVYTQAQLVVERAKANELVNRQGGVEYDYPNGQAALAVVWDRPVSYSDRTRILLRQVLAFWGVDDTSVAHCWTVPTAQGNQAPTLEQVRTWRQGTVQAITASGARYLLLVGKVATSVWRERVDFGWMVNHMYVMDSQWMVWPVYSPSAVMMDPTLNHEWRLGIQEFCEHMQMDSGLTMLADRCSKKGCKHDFFLYDADGAGWCIEHAEEGLKERKNERVARNKYMHKQQQEGLL